MSTMSMTSRGLRSSSVRNDADTGSVFGYESVLEDRSVFTQFSFNFQDDLPALLSRFRLELPSGWTAESITDNHRPIEPLVNGSSYSWQLEGLPPVSDDRLGSLEAGKLADIVLVDVRAPELTPLYDVYSHLVFAIKAGHVATVLVGGRVVVRDKDVVAVDEAEVMEKANELKEQILRSLGAR